MPELLVSVKKKRGRCLAGLTFWYETVRIGVPQTAADRKLMFLLGKHLVWDTLLGARIV
jgi:hypothetical protein